MMRALLLAGLAALAQLPALAAPREQPELRPAALAAPAGTCDTWRGASVASSLTEKPERVRDLFAVCQAEFARSLGEPFHGLTRDGLKLAFASVVAYDMKPYAGSMAFTLEDLLAAPGIDCDNYIFLTWYLFQLLEPEAEITFRMVGWNGGYIGNHAQIFADGTGLPLVLDPTIGLVAVGTFDDVGSGKPVTAMKEFYWRTDRAAFRSRVVAALGRGLYKPSELLYWYHDPQEYVTGIERIDSWATPQAKAVAPQLLGTCVKHQTEVERSLCRAVGTSFEAWRRKHDLRVLSKTVLGDDVVYQVQIGRPASAIADDATACRTTVKVNAAGRITQWERAACR